VIVCRACGFRNQDDLDFCAGCGAFLEWAADAPATAEPAAGEPPAGPATGVAPEVGAPADSGAAPHHAVVLPADPHVGAGTGGPLDPTASHADGLVAVEDPVAAVLTCLDDGAEVARAEGRSDLGEHLDAARRRLSTDEVGVAVLGEFKQGKSTLVNAVVNAAVCPVDADIVTAVPTIVRYGVPAGAVAHYDDGDGVRRSEALSLAEVADAVSGATVDVSSPRPRAVEVQLDRRVLRGGLTLIDTPGVGGLESAEGHITLATLTLARAVLFVTDASQELTAPELAFLRAARSRCDSVLLVITKTDLFPDWRRIVELDAGHLARAGLDIGVVAVSSFLRLLAGQRSDPALDEESGYPRLLRHLGEEVVHARAREAGAAADELRSVVEQVAVPWSAEREVLATPERAAHVVGELRDPHADASRLLSPDASWQQVLSDGVQDLVADMEHDLRERFRALARSAEGIIERNDPAEDWEQFEGWLRRQVADQWVQHLDLLAERAEQLAGTVSARFDGEVPVRLRLRSTPMLPALDQLVLEAAVSSRSRGGRTSMALTVARSSNLGILVGATAGRFAFIASSPQLFWIYTGVPVAVALVVGLGRKALMEERARQLASRRQRAVVALRKYLENVTLLASKGSKDALRTTQRDLRDECQRRARTVERSAAHAVAAGERAMAVPDGERSRVSAEIDAEIERLEALVRRVSVVVGPQVERVAV
jgi:hypothetical protein